MSKRTTGIEWTDRVWNPTRGCSPVSPGCAHCYAAQVARTRLSGPGRPYEGLTTSSGHWNGQVRFVAEKLDEPLHWREPCRVFVDSMSDLFHSGFSDQEIAQVLATIAAKRRHTFIVVTKRIERYLELMSGEFGMADSFERLFDAQCSALSRRLGIAIVVDQPISNLHIVVSCEDQKRADERIPLLLQCPAAVRGVSLEPLLGPIDLTPWIHALSWVIWGSESGPRARPMELEWGASIVRQCRAAGIACFSKQIANARDRKGANPTYWPCGDWPREFPT